MGRVGFSARIIYGDGIFGTISPSERHGVWALRLSRYSRHDPFMEADDAEQEFPYIGWDSPRVGPEHEDDVRIELPEYELRKKILARDPLAAVDAFTFIVRFVLAVLLGVRMCPDCPHCCVTDTPCTDHFGSNGTSLGGILARLDALFGGVENQRSTGTLHYHFLAFVQRAHQHLTLQQIADMLQDEILKIADLKSYHENICCEWYPEIKKQEAEQDSLEAQWPAYAKDKELGKIPAFLWPDPEKPHLFSSEWTSSFLQTLARILLEILLGDHH